MTDMVDDGGVDSCGFLLQHRLMRQQWFGVLCRTNSPMFVPPNEPNKRPQNQCRENPSLPACDAEALGAEEHAGKNKVNQHNAHDYDSECDGGDVRLGCAFGAEKTKGAHAAAGLRVVGAVG